MSGSIVPLGSLLASTAGSVASGGITGPARLHQAAQAFEALFMRQVLAAARQADSAVTGGDTMFDSEAMRTFREMQDARFADVTAQRGSLGIAAMIERQMGAPAAAGSPAPAAPAGG